MELTNPESKSVGATNNGKTTQRKTPARRTPRPKVQRTPIAEAPPDQCFWVNFGPVVKNLQELRDALATMSDEQFAHHVGPGKNDFANWVDHVLGHTACAQALRRAKTKRGALKAVETQLQ